MPVYTMFSGCYGSWVGVGNKMNVRVVPGIPSSKASSSAGGRTHHLLEAEDTAMGRGGGGGGLEKMSARATQVNTGARGGA